MTDWTDIASLKNDERGELLDIIHDRRLQSRALADASDQRAYIIFDMAKQRELFARSFGGIAH